MNILVINGSPSGENSITLQTVNYIGKFFPQHSFEVIDAGRKIRSIEKDFEPSAEALRKAELIIFCYPVYTFLVPAQLHRFIELIKESGIDLSGKPATQITTSKHFYDVTAHRFIQDNCDDMGFRYLRGLSADMEDLLTQQGRTEAEAFFRFVLWQMARGHREPRVCGQEQTFLPLVPAASRTPVEKKKAGTVVIVTDRAEGEDDALGAMIDRFRNQLPYETRVVNLRTFPFGGGCLGCFHCAADGTCVHKDGFDRYLRENIQTADAIVYAYTIRDHSMGYRFKLYDDRQFCNGHRTVTMGKPVGYLVDGALSREENLRLLMEARAQVGGNYLAGIAGDEKAPEQEIDQLAETLAYAIEKDYQQPKNFFGVGGLKIFRDLIYQMQGLMRADHRFYREHGFYDDFPQKHRGRIAAMYLVGAMMKNKKLQKKLSGKMTEGMTLPYKKVIEKAQAPSLNAR
jgi:multimeric flavodoxin WrbA